MPSSVEASVKWGAGESLSFDRRAADPRHASPTVTNPCCTAIPARETCGRMQRVLAVGL